MGKNFEIRIKGEGDYDPCPAISKRYNLEDIEENELVTLATEIEIEYVYPLAQPCSKKFVNKTGFTKFDLLKAIQLGYREIYKEEEAAVGDPGYVPGLMNRARSKGPHGIWGHYIRDLVLEGVNQVDQSHFKLEIGS